MGARSSANKRQRTEVADPPQKPAPRISTHSRILAPYRSLGHITSPTVPFSCIPRGSQTFQITTSVGTTLQTYDIRRLNLVFISSPATPSEIRRVVAWKEYVFAAFGGTVSDSAHGAWVFKRGKKVAELDEPMGGWNTSGWRKMLIFGDWIVGAFGDGQIVVWKVSTKEVHTEIQPTKGGGIVGVIHPSTYLNKVVVARTEGGLQIWNVKTGKLIYTCTPNLGDAKITSLTNTTHLHHIAFSTTTSQIRIHNILADTTLFTLGPKLPPTSTTSAKRVVSLSFCTDSSVGAGTSPEGKRITASGSGRILAAGDTDGDITLWDLEKRRIVGVMRAVHSSTSGGILKCEFLAGQKIMVTTGGDNSLKEWIFDSPHTILPRILRQRSGHSAPPTVLAFHNPQESHFLLSASQDRTLWGISLRNDAQSFELSQGSAGVSRKAKKANLKENLVETKAPSVTAIAISDSDGAKRDWENIITAHRGETAARTWHYEMKRLGRWVFHTSDGGEAKSVAISACGNFAFVGSSKGSVDMWNLQSGLNRGSFPRKSPVPKKKKVQKQPQLPSVEWKGHTGAVTGIITDATNNWVATTGLDGKIKFWAFLTGKLLHEIDWSHTSTGITAARLYRDSDLLALACDDFCIRVIDTETRKVVRELWGAGGRISDFCFSNDGRWILSASTDSVLRIYDLPTGHLIDGIRTPSIITSLAWSGKGEFLVTGHVDSVGVALWTNRTLFTRIPTRRLKEEDIIDLALPSSSGEGGTSLIDSAINNNLTTSEDPTEEESGVYISRDQLSDQLLTLSLVPKTRWQTLLHLDLVKQRNKPTSAPQKPKSAPFFLGALSSLKDGNTGLLPNINPLYPPTAEEAAQALAEQEAEKSRIMRLVSRDSMLINGAMGVNTSSLLRACADISSPSETAFEKFVAHFKSLPPASADLEIRSLDTSYWVNPTSEDDDDEDGSPSPTESDTEPEEIDELTTFIHALTFRLRLNRDWDLVNAWIAVFLKVHGELIIEICSTAETARGKRGRRARRFREALVEFRKEERREGRRVADLAGYCAGVVGFLRSR
ncbi:Utp21 specific WD40 associated putative domain-containing protein [Terfezia claveryi]|nr:Utp21 specific WD40 associated putative domain-containing protein [Terfezia claveryi]